MGAAYYLAASRFNLLSNSSLRVQMLAFSVSSAIKLIRLRFESLFLKSKTLNQIVTVLPCILNGVASCLSELSCKLTLINTGVLGGIQLLQLLIIQHQKKEIIDHIIKELKGIFPSDTIFSNKPVDHYSRILQETQDINAQCEGWTLLHYCTYMFSYTPAEEKRRRLLNLMEYMVALGADREKVDNHGRTPIYFASSTYYESQSELNEQYWKLLSANKQLVTPKNESVQPLHTVASLTQKLVIDLIKRGAKTDAIDRYGRMPLHCAVIHSSFDPGFYNVKALADYEPKSVEHQDNFGNFPLYYAAVFGSDRLFKFLLKRSSSRAVSQALEKLKQHVFEEEQLNIYDSIYNVPGIFKVMFGAGLRAEKKKKLLQKQLEEEKENKETSYQGYDTYHDGHGWKHVIKGNVYNQRFKNEREFIKSTKSTPAIFFPDFGNNYESLVKSSIESWVDKGADKDHLYVEFPENVGADNGNLTKTVEIYFSASGGAHIRPKYLANS